MSIDDQVYAGNLARNSRADVFARNPCRDGVVAGRLIEPGMCRDDHDVRARRFHLLHGGLHRGHDVGELHSAAHVGRIPHHHAGRRCADNPDFHALPVDNRPRLELEGPVRLPGVGRQHWKPRLRYSALEVWNAVVVFVVADRGGIVAHRIHRCDDRVR